MLRIVVYSYQKFLILHNPNFKTKLKCKHTPFLSLPGAKIHNWGVVMKMKSIPEGFPFDSAIEENSQPMEADKEFHVTFWNYFIIGKNFILLSFSFLL
ncbi:hypothetical protein AAG906_022356 [Vitis piasezkii]